MSEKDDDTRPTKADRDQAGGTDAAHADTKPTEDTEATEVAEPAEDTEATEANAEATPDTAERAGQGEGRDRLAAAIKHPSRAQVIAAVLLAILGFAAVVQVRANEADAEYVGARQEDLVQLLNSLAAASQRAENEIAQLEQTRNSLRTDTDSRRVTLEQARQQATVLGILAGTVPAVGPGVVVTVEDPEGAVGTDQLLNGLQELRDAGAEAIEINDAVRVVAQTSLEDGEEGVVVDGQPLAPPYVIEAIGDSHTLAEALDFTGGFVDVIEGSAVGGDVVIKEVSSVEIATLHQPEQPEYAEPVDAE